MPTLPEAIEALEEAARREERAIDELAAAKAARRNLERVVLPPLFSAARQKKFVHEDGTQAIKTLGSHARWPKDETQRQHALAFLEETGNLDALKTVVSGSWGRGEYEIAKLAYEELKKSNSAKITMTEDIHWKTYENIILETFKAGKVAIPFEEIGVEVFDEVKLTARRKTDD